MDTGNIAIFVAVLMPIVVAAINRFGGKSDRSDEHILDLRKSIADLREAQLMQEIRIKDYMSGQYASKSDLQAIETQLKGLRAIIEPVFRRMFPDAAVPE